MKHGYKVNAFPLFGFLFFCTISGCKQNSQLALKPSAPFTISNPVCYLLTTSAPQPSAIALFSLTANSAGLVCGAWGNTINAVGSCTLYDGAIFLAPGETALAASMDCVSNEDVEGDSVSFFVTCTNLTTGFSTTQNAITPECGSSIALIEPSGDAIAEQAFNWYNPTDLIGIDNLDGGRVAKLGTSTRVGCPNVFGYVNIYAKLQNSAWVPLNGEQWGILYGVRCNDD